VSEFLTASFLILRVANLAVIVIIVTVIIIPAKKDIRGAEKGGQPQAAPASLRNEPN
jgi:hypothetical protein